MIKKHHMNKKLKPPTSVPKSGFQFLRLSGQTTRTTKFNSKKASGIAHLDYLLCNNTKHPNSIPRRTSHLTLTFGGQKGDLLTSNSTTTITITYLCKNWNKIQLCKISIRTPSKLLNLAFQSSCTQEKIIISTNNY